MKSFSVTTTIAAKPEKVWAVLIDAPGWTSWNTTVDKVEGEIQPNQTVKLFVKLNPGRAFPVKVSTFEAPRRMVWTGGMPLGLFKGERTYELVPKGDGVEFTMREAFTGLLAGLITKSIPDMQPAFDDFARDLKKRAEES
jgi:hypothetical protein